MNLASRLATCQVRVETGLERWLPPPERVPGRLHEAMRYATLGGGKRIRPCLVYLAGEAAGAEVASLDGPACAVEIIHAYSLIHDDLPAMDDDDLRRGRPTCHRAFDEATAILAGDALQVLAFDILAEDPDMVADPARRLEIIRVLARASGTAGMAGGQALDLAATGHDIDVEALTRMHRLKTGALIAAAVVMGALSAPATDAHTVARLEAFGRHIGLAFQIRDDILDVEGDAGTLGKATGADEARHKPTFPSILGMEAAKRRARELCEQALAAIVGLDGKADPLRELARYIVLRDR